MIVDVDLSFPSCDDPDNLMIVNSVKEKKTNSILLQGLTIPAWSSTAQDAGQGAQYYYPRCGDVLDLFKQSEEHSAGDQYQQDEHVYWAFPAALADSNLVVREWKLATPLLLTPSGSREAAGGARQSADDQPRLHIHPGIGLISFALVKCPDSPRKGPLSSACTSAGSTNPETILQKMVDVVEQSHINDRIIYTIPWNAGENENRSHAGSNPIFTRVSAADIYDGQECNLSFAAIEELDLSKSIVIIGGSYFDGRDLHPTPIGLMPGAMVMVNGINSLLALDIVDESPGWLGLAIGVLLGLVGACIAQYKLQSGSC